MAGLGYTAEDAAAVPAGAEMGLGCGNPHGIASLKTGETVLDLGSGGGLDCFLAARQVGDTGHVIGVDMTPEMIARARQIAVESGADNVEFRLGEIEHLPVDQESVDVILSNCVINLSPNKPQVYVEAYRVLSSGGRLAIADIVASAPLPEAVRTDLSLHAGCVAGAASIAELEAMLTDVGFTEVNIQPIESTRRSIRDWAPGANLEDYIVSAIIEARKP
jgi:SAM-dependent methyltransferase